MSSSAGRVLLMGKGDYASGTTYHVLDWVRYNGRPYVAKQTTTGNAPIENPTAGNPDNYWDLLLDFPTQIDSAPTQNSNNLVSSGGVYTALTAKQNTLTFDSTPTANSTNPVTSGGVKTALDGKQGTLTFDTTPTANSMNPVTSGGVKTALDGKQGTLTFDSAPTANSSNPVTSAGIKTALDAKQGALTFDNTPTAGSSNPVTSAGIKAAVDNAGHTIKDTTTTYPKRKNLVFDGFWVEDDSTNNATIIHKNDPISLVSWSTGTDAEIKAMIDAYYAGELTLEDIQSVWSIGDEREVTLSAMAATGVGESHAAQTVKFVIMNWGGKTLSDNTECLAIVGQKNSLSETGYMNSSNTNAGGWNSSARRTWCNNVYKESIPSDFRSLFKQHKNLSGTGGGSSSGTQQTTDYFALPAEIEVFGSTTYSVAGEGSQFKYYETSANRVKVLGEGGSADGWWERSPRSDNSDRFCIVVSGGNASINRASSTFGLAPFGCI